MWFSFALLSALANAVATVARRTHGSTARPVELAWWSQAAMLPCSLVLLAIDRQPLWKNHNFLLPTLASATIYCFATVLLFTAYKYGQTSVVTPLGNLLPVGLLLSSFIMFGMVPKAAGAVGVVLVAGGVYYSSVSGKHSLLQPFRALWQQRGSRAMLCVIILWSVGTNLDKIALRSVSPAFLVFWLQLLDFILLSMYLSVQKKQRTANVWRHWWRHIMVMAAFTTLAIYFQNKAVQLLGNTSYVLAVKRLDVLLVVLFSGLFLKEQHLLKRFTGSLIALAGVVIIFFVS